MTMALAQALMLKKYLEELSPVLTGNLSRSYDILRRGNEYVIYNSAPYVLEVNFREGGRYHFIERALFRLELWKEQNGIVGNPPKLYFKDYGGY